MNLKELKSMIAEEYNAYIAEQANPSVAVSDADVDATGGDEDAEATLRDIYEMLKDFFEGGAGDDMDAPEAAADADDDEAPEDAALQERFKKLANIIKG